MSYTLRCLNNLKGTAAWDMMFNLDLVHQMVDTSASRFFPPCIAKKQAAADDRKLFRKAYYEELMDIKLPVGAQILEARQMESNSVTVFKVDAAVLGEFVNANNFDTIKTPATFQFFSNRFLTQYKAEFSTGEVVYRLQGPMTRFHWELVADVRYNTLWLETFYPIAEGATAKAPAAKRNSPKR